MHEITNVTHSVLDQQEVLKRCKHAVELADGRLEFTVRGSLEAPNPSNSTTPTAPEEVSAISFSHFVKVFLI